MATSGALSCARSSDGAVHTSTRGSISGIGRRQSPLESPTEEGSQGRRPPRANGILQPQNSKARRDADRSKAECGVRRGCSNAFGSHEPRVAGDDQALYPWLQEDVREPIRKRKKAR